MKKNKKTIVGNKNDFSGYGKTWKETYGKIRKNKKIKTKSSSVKKKKMKLNSVEYATIHALMNTKLGLEGLICFKFFAPQNRPIVKEFEKKGLIEIVPHPIFPNMDDVVRLKGRKYASNFDEQIKLRQEILKISKEDAEKMFKKYVKEHNIIEIK